MHDAHEAVLLSACRVLFGPDVEVTSDFLWYLQPEGAKVAYRKRARESHPDAHPWAQCEHRQRLHEEFSHLSAAYQTLQSYLALRSRPHAISGQRRTQPKQTVKPRKTGQLVNELYYQGPVPWLELKLGRYLYFRGLVSYQAVLQALRWQRAQRSTIGVLARMWGWLNDAAVHRILQAEQVSGRFGERARRLGLLSREQVQKLLATQQRAQKRLGGYFVEQGLLQETQLAILDYERLLHNSAVVASCCQSYDA